MFLENHGVSGDSRSTHIISTVEMVDVTVGGVRRQRKSAPYIPRACRWVGMKQAGHESLVKVIDVEEFNFHPYVFTPRGTFPVNLFGLHNQEIYCHLEMH